jgi:hypothetical protein
MKHLFEKPNYSIGISSSIAGVISLGIAGLIAGFALPRATEAQIGGSGWSPETVSFNVQWPYNVSESSRYTYSGGVYHCWCFTNDAPFEQGSSTLPRTEQRFNPDYTSGEIQYQSELMCPANENSYCIFQIHTGDAQEGQYGSTTFMLFWFSSDGGSVHDYSGTELAKNLGGKYFTLNADHNLVTHTIKIWINGTLVWTQQDNGATDFYMKDGVYEQSHGPTYQMDTYIKSIQMWTSSGVQSLSGTYELQNVASGLVMNNQGSLTNGSAITQWAETSSANLEWTFVPTSNGYYQIQSVKSGLDAVVKGASTANGAGIVQWSFGSSGDDQWLPEQNSDGSYTFVNLHSGLVLEDPGSSKSDTTQMDQYSSNGGSNQHWNLISE